MGKILGIDYGLKRVGLAIGNEEYQMALPYMTLNKNDNKTFFKNLKEVIEKENISKIVVGLPLYLNGEKSLTTTQVKNFAEKIKKMFSIPIYLIDERYTSFEAEKKISELNIKNKKKKKEIIDQISATLILESYFTKFTEDEKNYI
ncbi:Holliday junction resolvase RuvX [Desulfonauticus submarinus]